MNDSNDDNENNKMNIKRYNYKVNSNSLITFEIKKQNHSLNTLLIELIITLHPFIIFSQVFIERSLILTNPS
jgi:DNA-directed RNA polymerase subunit L